MTLTGAQFRVGRHLPEKFLAVAANLVVQASLQEEDVVCSVAIAARRSTWSSPPTTLAEWLVSEWKQIARALCKANGAATLTR